MDIFTEFFTWENSMEERDVKDYCFYKADGNFLVLLIYFLVFFYEISLFKYVLLVNQVLNTEEHVWIIP